MASADSIKRTLQSYADTSGDLDLRVSVGTPGYRIEVRNETQETGQGYVIPGFIDGLLASIGIAIDQVETEDLDVTNPSGQTEYTLAKTPTSDAALQIHKNGVLLRYGVGYTRAGRVVSISGAFGDWFNFNYRWSD